MNYLAKGSVCSRRTKAAIAFLLLLMPLASLAWGQESVARVKTLLAAFGVKGSLRIQGLGAITSPKVHLTTVEMTDSHGNKYTSYLDQDNRVVLLRRGEERDSLPGMEAHSLVDARQERRLRTWLAATGAGETTRLETLTSDEKGVGHAYFSILRNGYPFVSYPRYGYEFAFVVKTGEFLAFHAYANPPSVASGLPRLDKKGALAALQHIWDTKITPQAINVNHWRRVWYTLKGEPEIGYYLPEGQSTAILVWKIRYLGYRDVGYAVQGGDSGMLIDAVTGEQVPTKTVP